MGNSTASPRGRMIAVSVAVVLAATLASCGLFAGPDVPPGPSASAGSAGGAADASPDADTGHADADADTR